MLLPCIIESTSSSFVCSVRTIFDMSIVITDDGYTIGFVSPIDAIVPINPKNTNVDRMLNITSPTIVPRTIFKKFFI